MLKSVLIPNNSHIIYKIKLFTIHNKIKCGYIFYINISIQIILTDFIDWMQNTSETNSHSNVNYPKLFDEIEIMCKRNQFSLKDVINDLDTKKEGRITRFKFEKVFNYLSIWMTKPILDQIIIEYTVFTNVVKNSVNKETGEVTKITQAVPLKDFHGATFVDTNKFVQDYETYIKSKTSQNNSATFSVSTSKKKTSPSQAMASTTSSSATSTSIDMPTINDLIRFGNSLKFQNTSIQEVMESFDTYHIGHVPVNKFLNGFGMNNLTKKLAQAYKRPPTNDVYYFELQKDVEKALKNNENSKTNSGNLNSMSQSNTLIVDEDNNYTYNGQSMPEFFVDFCHQLRVKGIDPYSTLSVYDKHKKQSILPCHFLASFMNFDPKFSPPQIQLLKDIFLNDENKFDYMSFCEAVDYENSKYEEELEKVSSKLSQKSLSHGKELNTKDVNDVLQKIKERIEIRHALLGDIIESYDPRKTGKIQTKVFFKILEKERYELDAADQKAIIEEFSDPNGQYIVYKPFVIAVSPPKRKGVVATPQTVMDRLKDYLNSALKISIKPLLLRLDTEKSGYVNFRQLLAVFSNISFDINNHERRALLNKVGDQINIESFCDQVDYLPPATLFDNQASKEEDEDDDDEIPTKEVLDALARLYSIVLAEQNRIDLLDEFQRFTSSVDGLMNISQFRSSLLNVPSLERIPPEDVSLFTSYYTSPPQNMVDLKKFISDLTKFGPDQLKMEPSLSLYPASFLQKGGAATNRSQLSPTQKTSQRFQHSSNYQASDNVISAFTYSSPLVKSKTQSSDQSTATVNLNNSFDLSTNLNSDDFENVSYFLRRLKVYLVKKELNSISLFLMYDSSRNGYVLKDRVGKILSSIYFEYTNEELQQVLLAFQSQRMKNCFNYKRFVNVLENAKTNVDDLRSLRVKPIDEDPMNHPQNYELASLINTLHAKLSERHKRAEFAFYDVVDKTVSADEFRERIGNYGLIIPLSQVQLLIENYRANLNNDIDWKRFCSDVNSIRTVEPPRL